MVEDPELRERAIKRLREKTAFKGHMLAYVLGSATSIVIWAMTMSLLSLFWPAFLMLAWGIRLQGRRSF